MERKLASIQRIISLEPIAGADKIEKATVLGWELVVKKGEFKVGELCIYCEVDSVLPDKKEFEFLRDRKFRIKTIKLKGQVSQGICFPLGIIPMTILKEGEDVTERIGIVKYETPTEKNERKRIEIKANKVKRFLMKYSFFRELIYKPSKSGFPSFIKKTDEDRIQLFPRICEDHKDTIFQVTEKLDGQSATYFLVRNEKKWFEFWKDKFVFGVCSRNYHLLREDNSSWWTVAKQLDMKSKLLRIINDNKYIVIQGEILGAGIQGNKYGIEGYDFYVFNIFNDKKTLDNSYQRVNCSLLGLKVVPMIDDFLKLKPTIRENVEYAKGQSNLNSCLREGLVFRNYEKNISFKIINPDFLLKYDE
jgi:hypothetical protein